MSWNCKTNAECNCCEIIEFDEIVGHVPDFLGKVLAPTMRSEEKIASIDVVCTGEPRNDPKGTRDGGIEILCISQIYGCEKKR